MMNFINGFATYNIFSDRNAELIKKINIEKNILFDYREDPSYLNWISKENGNAILYENKLSEDQIKSLLKDYKRAYELIIYAPNEKIAQDINNLIDGGKLLAYPNILHSPSSPLVSDIQHKGVLYEYYRQKDINENMLFACLIASKSWGNTNLIYSIEKYKFSLQLDSITPHSASPIYGQVFSVESGGYNYHVKAAYAFLSAYSIIEELKLDIRSSDKKHRFINNEWNPDVKNDLIKRLSEIGIDETETINFVIRGTPNKIFQNVKNKFSSDSEYNDNVIVNDQKMKIYDAIHYCSYVRNFFIGHKFNEIVSSFTPYDIHNVQMLARRLILGKLDLWNFDEDNTNKYIK